MNIGEEEEETYVFEPIPDEFDVPVEAPQSTPEREPEPALEPARR